LGDRHRKAIQRAPGFATTAPAAYETADACGAGRAFRLPGRSWHWHKTVSMRRSSRRGSRALRGKIPGGHTKNLFLRDKKGRRSWWCAGGCGDRAQVAAWLLGASGRFSFGSAELLRELLASSPAR